MASIVLITSYSCEPDLVDVDALQNTQIIEENEIITPLPTIAPIIDDIPNTVEPLILEKDDTSNEVCPCDVKSAITSSKSTNIDNRSEEIKSKPSPTPTPNITKLLEQLKEITVGTTEGKLTPFSGTAYVSSEILVPTDPTVFYDLEKIEDAEREMYDRRQGKLDEVQGWITVTPHLFKASFVDGSTVEVQVNPEFKDVMIAEEVALKYLKVIGQLPTFLRKDLKTVWIHKGNELFGGGNNNILIHHDQGIWLDGLGLLEEIILHEAAHTSLDNDHLSNPEWLKAAQADGQFISDYAKDFPYSEDVAESFPMYFALRYKASRLEPHILKLIEDTIPNRIEYFDKVIPDLTLDLNLSDIVMPEPTNTPSQTTKSTVHLINIKNYEFQDISIDVGDVIQWKNLHLDTHSVTSGIWGDDNVGKLWDSGRLEFGEVFNVEFFNIQSGQYPYFCRIHPAMKGVIKLLDLTQ